MQGNNELHLNTATIIEAVQLWLDSKMVSAPTVTDIKAGNRIDGVFVVEVSSDAGRPEAPQQPRA